MTGTSQQQAEQSQTAWLRSQDGICVKTSLNDIKVFAYGAYDSLDLDGDGFVTQTELSNAFTNPSAGWREKSFLLFLIRRIEDISDAYKKNGQWKSAEFRELICKSISSNRSSRGWHL